METSTDVHGRADLYSSRELHDLRLLESIILALLLKFDLARFDIPSVSEYKNCNRSFALPEGFHREVGTGLLGGDLGGAARSLAG